MSILDFIRIKLISSFNEMIIHFALSEYFNLGTKNDLFSHYKKMLHVPCIFVSLTQEPFSGNSTKVTLVLCHHLFSFQFNIVKVFGFIISGCITKG